jgi:hypothetical protein
VKRRTTRLKNDGGLSIFLLRIVISGVVSGFLVGLLLLYESDLVLGMVASMMKHSGVNLTGSDLENTLNMIKTTVKFYPVIEPINSAVTLAVIGLISWFIAGITKSRYKTAMIITVILYGVLVISATIYIANAINDNTPIYLMGLSSVASFIVVLLVLEWKDIPGTEPVIT